LARTERALVVVGAVNALVTVATVIGGANAVAFWYMELFYGQSWFRRLGYDEQEALRQFIDRLIGPAVWPLVATNAVWVALYVTTVFVRRRSQKAGDAA
jgi:hypothetical protein